MTQAPAGPALRITVTDTSTVFTGAANLHRFDAPSAREVAAYVRNLFGPDPQGAEVHLAASPERLAEIEAALAGYDVFLTSNVLDTPGAPPTQAPGAEALQLRRPVDTVEEDRRAVWIIGSVVAGVAVACAVAVVVTARSLFGAAGGEVATTQSTPSTSSAAATSSAVATQASASVSPVPATVVHERAGVRVELPAGFTLEEDAGMWRATGPDPDFRLHIAVDDLFTLPAETMAEQVRREVEADPQTELVETDGFALTYIERPGDGSEVMWKTWPHGTHQIFVACQTRGVPTRVQQATCRMAFDSAEYAPGPGDL